MVLIPEDHNGTKGSNHIIVPVYKGSADDQQPHDNLPPYSENVGVTGEALIQELKEHVDDLALLSGGFGPKLSHLLQISWVRGVIFRDHTKLNLLCLGHLDQFSNEQTLIFNKPTLISGSEPLLYWLYTVTLNFLSTTSSRGVHLKLTPTHQSGHIPHQIDIELKSGQSSPHIELTLYHGGTFDKREVFSAPIQEIRLPKKTKYGEPLATPDDIIMDSMPINGSLTAVFDYLFPRQDSKWRIAMNDFQDDDEEQFLGTLVQACKAQDDVCFVSNEQDIQCRNLFNRFPEKAKEFFKDKVGKPGGPYSARAMAPCEKD